MALNLRGFQIPLNRSRRPDSSSNNAPYSDDYVTVEGTTSPGLCALSGFARKSGFDVKNGKATKGATLTLTGAPPMEGKIKFFLWTTEHFTQWNTFRKLFLYPSTSTNVKAINVHHASISNDLGATSFVCKSVSAYEMEGEPGVGLYSVTVDLIEYIAPVKKPIGATAAAAKPQGKTVPMLDAQQKRLADALARASAP